MTNFMNTNVPEPVAFHLFGVSIMWYGILIAAAILTAFIICCKRAPEHDIHPDRVFDAMIYCLPMGIIGTRLYYVAFNWSDYGGDILAILNIREGGLAVHGGLIFGFLTGIAVCKVRKISPLNGLDLAAPCVAIAQSIGRWGNYFNSEAHGGPTDLPWGIPIGGELVHPTFLYESIWSFLLFLFLIYIDNRRTFEGRTFLCYGGLYSFGRFFIEDLRTDSLMLGRLRQAQVLSAAVFFACCIGLIVLSKKAGKDSKTYYVDGRILE